MNESHIGSLEAASISTNQSARTTPITPVEIPGRWPLAKAKEWYASQPWLVGCNYLPATAINQLEMWQAETFDPATIDRELGLAESIGFNTLRVYLHDLVWHTDAPGFYTRISRFLELCDSHGIKPSFVFFDDCHRPFPKPGTQPQPVPAYHNSGWMNSPARDVTAAFAEGSLPATEIERLKGYVHDTIHHFGKDPRVLMWELYNEPGRGPSIDKVKDQWSGDRSAALLLAAWQWARSAQPSQPLCSTAEGSIGECNIALAQLNSDIHSFHNYGNAEELDSMCAGYPHTERPAICTEYMARPHSTFQSSLPVLRRHHIGAINWGFVSGKSGTIWPWSSQDGRDSDAPWEYEPTLADGEPLPEPELWFHDIYRTDGSPFDPAEIAFIKQVTAHSN